MRARHSTKSPQRKASLKRVRALTAELAAIAARQAEIVAELEGDEEALLAVRAKEAAVTSGLGIRRVKLSPPGTA